MTNLTKYILSFSILICAFSANAYDRQTAEQMLKMVEIETNPLLDQMLEAGQLGDEFDDIEILFWGKDLIYEYYYSNKYINANFLCDDYIKFQLVANFKQNIAGAQLFCELLEAVNGNFVYKYIDKSDNSYTLSIKPQEFLNLVTSDPDQLDVDKSAIFITYLKLEEANMKEVQETDGLADSWVQATKNYVKVGMVYNLSDSQMRAFDVEGTRNRLLANFSAMTNIPTYKASINSMKALGIKGYQFILQNKTGVEHTVTLTWNEIESNSSVSPQNFLDSECRAATAELRKSIGQDGISDAWCDVTNNYFCFNYVYDGITASIDNLTDTTALKELFISDWIGMKNDPSIIAYKNAGIIGIMYVFKDQNKPRKIVIPINFDEL
ncbi:MAG: hypothetical protein IJC40_02440 [Muribaculaceae bacterium]|nr:hypothetical protein [Muribaculaceae bacterium]